jgi:SAM-dependent methyltransferase
MVGEARRRCQGRAQFLVADLAEPLPVEPQSLDGITSSLALHYVRDWSVPLRSFASALRPGGWAVISFDHPFGPRLPSQQGGYFDTELVTDTWRKADVEVSQRFWRRPLSAIADAFADAGLVIDRIAEPQPSREALERYPSELAGIVGIPTFMVYRLGLAERRRERASATASGLLRRVGVPRNRSTGAGPWAILTGPRW